MFGQLVPATVEWLVEEAGFALFAARVVPAKGGPVLEMSALFPYRKTGELPLTEEGVCTRIEKLQSLFSKKEYKSKISVADYGQGPNLNVIRIKLLLKEKDIAPDQYALIKAAWKARAKSPVPMKKFDI